MKFKEISGLSVDELNKKLRQTRESLFELRMKNSIGQLGSPIQIRQARRDIARIRTALKQKLAQ